jgi:hypothetical protein
VEVGELKRLMVDQDKDAVLDGTQAFDAGSSKNGIG